MPEIRNIRIKRRIKKERIICSSHTHWQPICDVPRYTPGWFTQSRIPQACYTSRGMGPPRLKKYQRADEIPVLLYRTFKGTTTWRRNQSFKRNSTRTAQLFINKSANWNWKTFNFSHSQGMQNRSRENYSADLSMIVIVGTVEKRGIHTTNASRLLIQHESQLLKPNSYRRRNPRTSVEMEYSSPYGLD